MKKHKKKFGLCFCLLSLVRLAAFAVKKVKAD